MSVRSDNDRVCKVCLEGVSPEGVVWENMPGWRPFSFCSNKWAEDLNLNSIVWLHAVHALQQKGKIPWELIILLFYLTEIIQLWFTDPIVLLQNRETVIVTLQQKNNKQNSIIDHLDLKEYPGFIWESGSVLKWNSWTMDREGGAQVSYLTRVSPERNIQVSPELKTQADLSRHCSCGLFLNLCIISRL